MSLIEFARDAERDQAVTDNADDALPTKLNVLLAGELQQFNRQAGGPIAQYVTKTATGAVEAGPAICYGYVVTVAMSAAATTVYDNASAASGTVLFIIPASTAVGVYQWPVGVLCDNGIYASFAGTGTVNFLYVPAA
jgi:hypothetical protein